MKTRTSFPQRCSEFAKIYLWSLKENAGVGGILAGLMFAGIPVMLMIRSGQMMAGQMGGQQLITDGFLFLIGETVPITGIALLMLFAVLLSARMFCYLQNSHSVDLFHALPVGRMPMLLGKWFAGMTLLLLPVLVNFGIILGLAASNGCRAEAGAALQWHFGWFALFSAAVYTSGVFFMVCGSSVPDALLSMLIVNIGWPVVEYCAGFLVSRTIPGLNPMKDIDYGFLTLFSPIAAGSLMVTSNARTWGWYGISWFLPWWGIFTAALLLAVCVIFARRKSEASDNRAANRGPKILMRFFATVSAGIGFCLLGFNLMKDSDQIALPLLFAAAGSFLVHTITIPARGFHALKRSLRGYAAALACLVAFFGIIVTGCFGYDTYVPQASEVESVTVRGKYDPGSGQGVLFYTDYGEPKEAGFAPVLEKPEEIETVVEAHRSLVGCCRKYCYPYRPGSSDDTFSITYHLKNGGTVSRSFAQPAVKKASDSEALDAEWEQALDSIRNLDGYRTNSEVLYFIEPYMIYGVAVYSNPSNSCRYMQFPEELKSRLLIALKEEDTLESRKEHKDSESEYKQVIVSNDDFDPSEAMRKVLDKEPTKIYGWGFRYFYRPGGEVDQVLQEIAATAEKVN